MRAAPSADALHVCKMRADPSADTLQHLQSPRRPLGRHFARLQNAR